MYKQDSVASIHTCNHIKQPLVESVIYSPISYDANTLYNYPTYLHVRLMWCILAQYAHDGRIMAEINISVIKFIRKAAA